MEAEKPDFLAFENKPAMTYYTVLIVPCCALFPPFISVWLLYIIPRIIDSQMSRCKNLGIIFCGVLNPSFFFVVPLFFVLVHLSSVQCSLQPHSSFHTLQPLGNGGREQVSLSSNFTSRSPHRHLLVTPEHSGCNPLSLFFMNDEGCCIECVCLLILIILTLG